MNGVNIWGWMETVRTTPHLQQALYAFATAFITTLALTPLVIRIAQARGLVAKPSQERWHKKPTALFGGVAIFAAMLITALFFLPAHSKFSGVVLGTALIFLIGLIDDYRPLRPATKFIGQLMAACLFIALFFGTGQELSHVWLVPLSLLWIAGITNAFNLLDNMDGLTAGVAALVALLMTVQAMLVGNVEVAIGTLIVAGAAGGFLVYNFNPARIFMGDCGSMTLGFALACLALMGETSYLSGNLFMTLLLPAMIFAAPLFDTIFVSAQRFANGRPISLGGRDHTSHRLVLLGLSEKHAVCWLYAITLWFGLISVWGSLTRDLLQAISLAVLSVTALIVLGRFLSEVQVYSERELEDESFHNSIPENKTIVSRIIMHKRRFVEAFLDFCLICACLIAAFWLRFEDQFSDYTTTLSIILPYMVVGQMVAFWFVGLYYGLWRYMTVSDAKVAVRGVVLGTVLAYALIWFFAPLPAIPHSPFIIHILLLSTTMIGMRIGLKTLRHHFARAHQKNQRRALIVGAGDAGELTVRELFNNKSLQLQPVGFLDDDPAKYHTAIHGIKVLGRNSQLADFVERLQVDDVIIAMPSIGNGTVQSVIDFCREHDLRYHEVRGLFVKPPDSDSARN